MPAGDRNRETTRSDWWNRTIPLSRLALAVLVVTAAVLAGCGALSGSDGGAADGEGAPDAVTAAGDGGGSGGADDDATATPDAAAAVESRLSVPPETVFERVAAVAGMDPEEYPSVEFRDLPARGEPDPFVTQLAGTPPNAPNASNAAPVVRPVEVGVLGVYEERLATVDDATLERQLVYNYLVTEYVKRGWWELPDRPHDYAIIRASFRYIIDAYAERHRPAVADTPAPYGETTVSDYEWVASDAMDYYAYQWVDEEVRSPADATALLVEESPPSSEQFLTDTDDEPLALGLAVNSSESWYRKEESGFRTRGPVVTLAVLQTGIDGERARRAAEGWGQDRVAVFRSIDGEESGVVWTHRWDTAEDADEFESAMTDYLAHRRNETDDLRFEYRRLASDVTVVVTGPPAFTNATTVTYDTGNVTAGVGTDP